MLDDPNLKPEKLWIFEFNAEKDSGSYSLRLTYFVEDMTDALYSQTTLDAVANKNISRVQKVSLVET